MQFGCKVIGQLLMKILQLTKIGGRDSGQMLVIMPDEVIWHSNECHMRFLARRNHTMNYISIFSNFLI